MAVPLPTGLFTVRRPGVAEADRPAAVPGHASYRTGTDQRGPDGRRGQVGQWTLQLDPEAWPVTEVDLVDDDKGRTFRVHSAELRDAMPDLAHVTVDADRITADTSNEAGVDADGNVEEVPA